MTSGRHKHHVWPIALFAVLAILVLIYAVAAGGEDSAKSGDAASLPAPTDPSCKTEGPPGMTFAEIAVPVEEAASKVKADGGSLRAVVVDGQPQIVTMDYRGDRVNVEVADGVVIGYCGNY